MFRWMFYTVFLFIAALLLFHGISLFFASIGTIDGTGIGIYFFGIEINDTVPREEIPYYARRFLFAGMLVLCIPVLFYFLDNYLQRRKAAA